MSVNQPAIDRLRLDEAFSIGVSRPFNDCWYVRMDSTLMVIDDDETKVSRFSDDESDDPRSLQIRNYHNCAIVLLAIDNRLFRNHQGGIADCAIFDEESFLFIEFKTNAYGNSREQKHATYEKAIGQLEETLRLFRSRLSGVKINFDEQVSIGCHIVVAQSFPRVKAMEQEYSLSFADNNGGVGLRFDRKVYWGH